MQKNNRRFFRRRRYRRKNRGKVPEKVKKYVKNVIHRDEENKYIVGRATSVSPISNYNIIGPTNAIATGTGVSERLGNEIKPVRWRIRVRVGHPSTESQHFRVVVFVDKQTNGTNFNIASLFNSTTSNAMADPSTAIYNPDWVPRAFQILYDRTMTVNSANDTSDARGFFNIDLNLRKQPKVKYNGTGAGVSTIVSGAYYIMVSTSASLLTNVQYVTSQIFEYEDA